MLNGTQQFGARSFAARCAVAVMSVLAFSLAGCSPGSQAQRQAEASPMGPILTIITPHSEAIREAFEIGFSDWHHAKRGQHVKIDWIVRGTPQCVDFIQRFFAGAVAEEQLRREPDLMFGGGVQDHAKLAELGLTAHLDMKDMPKTAPETIAGLRLRDPKATWFTTGLSSFGIVYNDQDCARRGIEPPATWTDLAAPRFHGWVAVADPSASGSHHQAMLMILQKQGWSKGWATLVRILANARALSPSSRDALELIKRGEFLASFAVNFDGLAAAAESSGRVAYVNPKGATAVTPDVISVLKSTEDEPLAADFVRFCLSKQGQELWGVRADQRTSFGRTLYHYPIDPEIYKTDADKLAVEENPYTYDFGVHVDPVEAELQSELLIPLVHALCDKHHVELQEVYGRLIQGQMPESALAVMTALPFDPDDADELARKYMHADQAGQQEIAEQWSQAFAATLDKAAEMIAQ